MCVVGYEKDKIEEGVAKVQGFSDVCMLDAVCPCTIACIDCHMCVAVCVGVSDGCSLESVRTSWCASLPGLPKSSMTNGSTLWRGYRRRFLHDVSCAAWPSLFALCLRVSWLVE